MRSDDYIATVRAALNGDKEAFIRTVRAVAANEGGQAGTRILRSLETRTVEKTMQWQPPSALGKLAKICPFPETAPALYLDRETANNLNAIVDEHAAAETLREHGLVPAQRILLCGPPGTGKTTAAAWLAHHLRLSMVQCDAHRLIDSHLGVTGANVATLFEQLPLFTGLFFFDEVDSMGGTRSGGEAASAEMSRTCNTLLVVLEREIGQSVVVMATNRADLLDEALLRRFDVVIDFRLPTLDVAARLIDVVGARLPDHLQNDLLVNAIAERSSHAVLTTAIYRERKRHALAEHKRNKAGIDAAKETSQ